MDIKVIGLIAWLFFSSALTCLHAQQAIPASGGSAAGSGGSVSYSVGQVLYSSLGGPAGTVVQGVQQPYEISVVSKTGASEILLECSVFPNPATDRLVLKTEGEWKDAIASLYGAGGKILESYKIRSVETPIDMGQRISAVYYLKVTRNGRVLKTFKIIRN